MQLRGKTLLVTGATGGLGRAIATALAERDAALVLSARKPADLEALAESLPGAGHRVVLSDLAEPGAPEKLAADAGELDGAVLNAGLGANGQVDSFAPGEVERILRVNFEAPVVLAREIVPALREQGSGHVVFIASLAGKASSSRHAVYGGTKAGLRAFALGLRQDVGRDGVGASVINPGFIRDAGMFAESGAEPPMNLGTSSPQEVGAAVVDAIEKNRTEVDVAPFRQRQMANFAHRFPGVAERLTKRLS
jgi:short-subunit dehydrogenase